MKLPTLHRTIASRPSDPATAEAGRELATAGRALVVGSSRGQVLVIFSGIFVVLLLMSALVIDLAWLWNNSLRIQRTADAAALAGVVNLPTNFSGNNGGPATCKNALTCALTEAARNGYLSGSGGVTVTPTQDGTNPRRLNVKVTAPVQTFFLGLIGMNQVIISRTAHAEYVLPVPMGSPENYYGVFGAVRDATFTTPASSTGPTTSGVQNTGIGGSAHVPSAVPSTVWSVSPLGPSLVSAIAADDVSYAGSTTNGQAQQWSTFGLSSNLPTPGNTVVGTTTTTRTVAITGLQLQLIDAQVDFTCAGSNIQVELSWNGGTNWTPITPATGTPTTNQGTTTQSLTTTTTDYTMGNTNNTTPWGVHPWVYTTGTKDFSDPNFRVRTTVTQGCGGTTRVNLDQLQVIVYYTVTTSSSTPAFTTPAADFPLYGPGVACPNGASNCYMGDHTANQGQALNARGFWGTMNTQGAENVNGDAFQPYYDTRTGGVALTCPQSAKACHGPVDYYNYGIEMQPNTSGGLVYIFDPVFCETRLSSGTADRHFSGSAAVSTFYQLYSDPNNTPYNLSDDALVVDSGNLFTGMAYQDSTMGGSNGSECKQTSGAYGDARDYHNAWYLLNPGNPLTGGPNGTLYRLHTTSTDPNNVTQQQGTNGEQSFAIYASSTQGFGNPADHPRVYGLGAMQAFTPLEAFGSAQASTFYLAQIDPVHNGKTLEIRLWDPGDTAPLSASLEILIPDDAAVGGFRVASVTYSGAKGTTNAGANSACNSNSRSTASSAPIQTSTGASLGLFNGCWLTIDTIIPSWYTGDQQGWWKIRYTMNGTGTSSDVTTWMADIRGNPVHLVEP